MKRIVALIVIGLFVVPVSADSTDAHGVWKTEKNDEGGYIEVTIAPCASDGSLTCGTISKAFTTAGVDSNYEFLGRLIIEDMKYHGGKYADGTIWDPESGKTYKSKMQLDEGKLDVDGCISFLCQHEHWQRVTE
ncbi:MAG: DUF2147 domain-containing protein [Anaerolineales bacterium]|nr:DUF2147 domain-containing protein [Anaerolineales bacterium]